MAEVLRTNINGSRRLSNFLWAFIVFCGGLGFFLSGLSSYFAKNFLFFSNYTEILFIPQGLTLTFYGTVGLTIGSFLWLSIYWDIGVGYNEYNKLTQEVTLYRKGFPGNNNEVLLKFPFSQIKSIKMFLREGLNQRRQLLLCLKDDRQIPLSGIDRTYTLAEIETQALKLAKYLNIYLETL